MNPELILDLDLIASWESDLEVMDELLRRQHPDWFFNAAAIRRHEIEQLIREKKAALRESLGGE